MNLIGGSFKTQSLWFSYTDKSISYPESSWVGQDCIYYTTRIGILEIDFSFLIALSFETKFLIKSKMYLIWKFWINNRICVETNKKVHTEVSVRFSMAVYSAVYSVQFTKYLIKPNGVKIQSNSVHWGNPWQSFLKALVQRERGVEAPTVTFHPIFSQHDIISPFYNQYTSYSVSVHTHCIKVQLR